MDNKLLCTKYL